MKTESNFVEASVTNSIGTIVLNNPGKHNALSKELIDGICSVLEQMQQEEVRVVILRAPAGSRVFSAGHDIRELPTNGRDPLTYDDPLRRVIRTIEHFPAPVIAMIEGSVWGGACELVMSCDIIVAADDSTFAITTAKLGVPYNISGIQNFLNTGGMPLCKEMLFTAQPIPVSRLLARGIVSHAVPRDQLQEPDRVHGRADCREFAPGRQPAQRGTEALVRLAQSGPRDLRTRTGHAPPGLRQRRLSGRHTFVF